MPKNSFDHHTPDDKQIKIIEEIRACYKDLGKKLGSIKGELQQLEKETPGAVNSNALRYAALAFTELEASCMWAVKSVIFAGNEPEETV